MKEDLICGVAILLYLVLLYLLTTAFIKTGRAVDRYKMKKKTDKIKVVKDTNIRTTLRIHLKGASM
nr:MAG: hypothetical protein [Bacteriophage sp.]